MGGSQLPGTVANVMEVLIFGVNKSIYTGVYLDKLKQ